jgi:transcriptional regulator with XRE-family HTH domain
MTFPERLITLRLKNELSQRQLAKRAGMSQSKVKRFELGEQSPKLEDIAKFSKAFRITTTSLLRGVETPRL